MLVDILRSSIEPALSDVRVVSCAADSCGASKNHSRQHTFDFVGFFLGQRGFTCPCGALGKERCADDLVSRDCFT